MDYYEDMLGLVPSSDGVQDVIDTPEPTSHLTEEASNLMNGNAHAEESKQDDSVSADGDENESAEVVPQTAVEEEENLNLSPELQEGLKILNHFLNDKLAEPFRDEVVKQLSEAEAEKYRREIERPICLFQMKEKFRTGEYVSITQVVNDFHLMIYNCQRFNGTSHPVSKKANKMYIVLKQKVALLRADIRSKIAHDSSQPWLNRQDSEGAFGSSLRKRTVNHRLEDSSAMISHLRMDEEQRAKEERRLKKEENKAAHAAAEKQLVDWEEEHITKDPVKLIIQHSWELPQIGLFLFLCRDVLGLDEITMYELERCLAMPQQSSSLQKIMTALLSNEHQIRDRLDKKGPLVMPYAIWTRKLTKLMDEWFSVLDKTCHGDKYLAACKLGLDEKSFDIIGLKNPLRERPFHILIFYKKVWILKSVCDYLVNKKDKFRLGIEANDFDDQRAFMLGTDRHGNHYIHFTQFCGPDVRIYRQRKPPVPLTRDELLAGQEEEEEEVEEEEAVAKVKPMKNTKSRAKRKLNYRDECREKRSRSRTPLNDSETDGTISPALSEVRTKSRASSSRHSSPMPRDTKSRSRQTSARNSPALDCSSSLDTFPFTTGSKGRKTRNSAESNFFEKVDLEALIRQNSRRSREARLAAKELAADAESVSTVGDESSQDGLRADTPSSSCAMDTDSKTEAELVNGKLSSTRAAADVHVKSESQDSSDLDAADKKDHLPTHSHLFERYRMQSSDSTQQHIKLEPGTVKCDIDSESADKMAESCDSNKGDESSSPAVPSAADSAASARNGSSLNSKPACDTFSIKAAEGNPADSSTSQPSTTPVSTHSPSPSSCVKKEAGSTDDSGFFSFQTSPRVASCDKDRNNHVSNSGKMSNGCVHDVKKEKQDGDVTLKSEESCDCDDYDDDVKKENLAGGGEVTVKTEEEEVKTDNGDEAKDMKAGEGTSGDGLQNGGASGSSNALLDHAAYSEEEMVPDKGDFELIVVDMDGLDRLVKQFEPEPLDASPHVSPVGAKSSKRQKSKSTPKAAKLYACEKDLYERLVFMQKELHKFRAKLSLSTRRSRIKLQREFLSFTDEPPKDEDLRYWERRTETEQESDPEQVAAEEAAAQGTLQQGKDNKDHPEDATTGKSTPTMGSRTKTTTPKATPASSAAAATNTEAPRDIEEYEADVSSRGRLRKRRLIPNNIEDQGVAKKKKPVAGTATAAVPTPPPPPQAGKKSEEDLPTTSNGSSLATNSALSSAAAATTTSTTTAAAVSGLITTTEDGTIKLNISNEEFLALVDKGGPQGEALLQQLARSPSGQELGWKPQGIRVVGGPIRHTSGEGSQKARRGALATASTPTSAGSHSTKSHPVMQKMLSTHISPGSVRPVSVNTGSGSFALHRKNPAPTLAPNPSPQLTFIPNTPSPTQQAVRVASLRMAPQLNPAAAEVSGVSVAAGPSVARVVTGGQAAAAATVVGGGGGAGGGGLSLQSNQLLMASNMKSGKQQVYVITPEQQRELIKSGLIKPQQIRQQVVVQAALANTVIRPQVVASGVSSSAAAGFGSVVVSVPPHTPTSSGSAARQPLLGTHQVLAPHPQTQAAVMSNSHHTPQHQHTTNPVVPAQDVAAAPVAPLSKGSVTAVKIVPSSNGQEMVGVPVVVGQVMPQAKGHQSLKPPMLVNNNPGGNRTLILHPASSGRSVPKYAGNVTVKELLESRTANNKSDDSDNSPPSSQESSNSNINSSTSTTPPASSHGRIMVTGTVTTASSGVTSMPVTSPLTVVTTLAEQQQQQQPRLVAGGLSSSVPLETQQQKQRMMAAAAAGGGVVLLPDQLLVSARQPPTSLHAGQSSLDQALQSVVTSYHTTLPTADIKVPSPTTLPSLSPRKSVTRIVQCTKAPIPTTTRVQAKHSSVLLTSNLVSGSPANNTIVSGVIPGGGAAVVPAGQSVAMPLSLQAKSSLPSAVQAGSQRMLTTVIPQPSMQHTVALSSLAGTEGGSSGTTRTMLVAKALTQPVSSSGAMAMMPQPTLGSTSGGIHHTSSSSQSGPFLTQNTLTQMPRVIRAPALMGMSGGSAFQVIQQASPGPRMVQTSHAGGVQLQNLAMAGLPIASAKPTNTNPQVVVDSSSCQQQRAIQGVVRMALPPGIQIAGMQQQGHHPHVAAGGAIRLVAGGHQPMGGGGGGTSNMQPVLATLKPGAPGLQQLQLVTGGLQGQGQQQLILKTPSSCVSGQSEDSKATVQLCFMPQGPPAMMQAPSSSSYSSSSANTVVHHHGVPQAIRPAAVSTSSLQPHHGAFLQSPPFSPCNAGTVSKVIMANPPTSQLLVTASQPALSGSGTTVVVSQAPGGGKNNNRTLLSITPGNVKSQFIVSPVSSQQQQHQGDVVRQQNSVPVDSQALLSATSQQQHHHHPSTTTTQIVNPGLKRSLTSADIHPIPAKIACVDSNGKSSGNVLAGLNQMVVGSGKTVTVCGDGAAGLHRVVMASSRGDNSASSTLLKMAAHVSPAGALMMSSGAPVSSACVSMPLLQGMGPGVVVAGGRPAQHQHTALVSGPASAPAPNSQKQPVLVVRNIGGQLLTDNNIPVTENNGQYKILPKATLQLGSQTVTVLSPSSAMIQNVRNPTTGTATGSMVSAPSGTPQSQAPLLPSYSTFMEGAASSLPLHNQPVVRHQTVGSSQRALSGLHVQGQAITPHQTVSVFQDMSGHGGVNNSTPLLKTRLEQPSLGLGEGADTKREAFVNGVAKPPPSPHPQQQQQQTAESSAVSAPKDSATGVQNVEEETALQLLRLSQL